LTRALDALYRERRELGVTKVENPARFKFVSTSGEVKTLLDIFESRKQLIVYNFMLYSGETEGCTDCSFFGDQIPRLEHLWSRDTTLAFLAPSETENIKEWSKKMGWTFPFYSSLHTFDEGVLAEGELVPWRAPAYVPKMSVFIRNEEEVYHSYSTANRGVEPVLVTYSLLDLTPRGRQDDGSHWKYHDKY
jgi:predicted dithiol-disulfide oxidoreductase (DUF899 family)